MGGGDLGINWLEFGTSGRVLSPTPSHPSLPSPPRLGSVSPCWKGILGSLEEAQLGPGLSFPPSHQSYLSGGRGQPSPCEILSDLRAPNPACSPTEAPPVGGGSTEQVQRKRMLVPEFYFRGWGGRRAGSGGVFGDPQGPQSWSGVGQERQTKRRGQKGSVGWL